MKSPFHFKGNNKLKNSFSKFYAILFLLNPILSFFLALPNYRSSGFRYLFAFLIAFLGFTTNNVGDLETYKEWFYNRETDFSVILYNWFNLESSEFYTDSLEYLVGSVFENHRFYFAFLFGFFGWLLATLLYEIYPLVPNKLKWPAILLLLSIILYYSIRTTLSMRFYTGCLFYLLMLVKYIKYGNKNYIISACLAPIFHIGLTVLLITIPLILLLAKNQHMAVLLVLSSYFVAQSSIVNTIESQAQNFSYTAVEARVKGYVSEEGREYLDNRYAAGAAASNWKLKLLGNMRQIIWWSINVGLFLIYFLQRKVLTDDKNKVLFTIICVTWSVSNVMVNISNGDRYMIIYTFLALCLFLFIYTTRILPNALKWFIVGLAPLVCAYGLMLLYTTNSLFTINFFLSNFFYEFILIV